MHALLIDLGNTRTKLRWIAITPHGKPVHNRLPEAELSLAGTLSGDPLHHALEPFLQRHAVVPFGVHGVQVGRRSHASELEQALRRHPLCQAVCWHSASPEALGLRNGYLEPSTLGPDRWMAALGVWTHAGPQASGHVLAMCGTASTVDTIDTQRRLWLGGIIAPGLHLMLESLHGGTARLPLSEGQWMPHPNNTHAAIRTGCLDAQAGLVLARYLEVREQLDGLVMLHFGGGAAKEIMLRCHSLLERNQSKRHSVQLVWHHNPVLLGLEAVVRHAHPLPAQAPCA